MDDDPRFEIKNDDIQSLLRSIGGRIAEIVADKPGWGFTLFLYTFQNTEPNSMFYISNSNRIDMVKMLEEFIEKVQNDPKQK